MHPSSDTQGLEETILGLLEQANEVQGCGPLLLALAAADFSRRRDAEALSALVELDGAAVLSGSIQLAGVLLGLVEALQGPDAANVIAALRTALTTGAGV